jgi:hypothetical protein
MPNPHHTTINLDDIDIPDACPLCGIDLIDDPEDYMPEYACCVDCVANGIPNNLY